MLPEKTLDTLKAKISLQFLAQIIAVCDQVPLFLTHALAQAGFVMATPVS